MRIHLSIEPLTLEFTVEKEEGVEKLRFVLHTHFGEPFCSDCVVTSSWILWNAVRLQFCHRASDAHVLAMANAQFEREEGEIDLERR